jgi:hypothetical protein
MRDFPETSNRKPKRRETLRVALSKAVALFLLGRCSSLGHEHRGRDCPPSRRTCFRANDIPTKKNGVIRDLYPRLGFTRAIAETPADSAIQWHLNLTEYVGRKTHIDRSAVR